jgi:hypothetical protein
MRMLPLLGLLAASAGGDRIEEVQWLPAKEAFEKAKEGKPSRWVLIYKEWPS